MNKQQLEDALDALHRELAEADRLDAEEVARLQSAMEEIRQVLEEQRPPERSLQQRLAELARHFEDSHPALTNTVGRVMDALAQIGI